MYGFGGVGLSEVQNSISELSVVGGWWVVGGLDKRTSWSDLVGVRQKLSNTRSLADKNTDAVCGGCPHRKIGGGGSIPRKIGAYGGLRHPPYQPDGTSRTHVCVFAHVFEFTQSNSKITFKKSFC